MKTSLIAFGLLLTSAHCLSQTWSYKAGGNAFDGTYKTSSITGIGSEFPYQNPVFVINVFKDDVKNPNVYFTSVPYAGCDNNAVLIKFDNEDKIYRLSISTNSDKEEWFLHFEDQYGLAKDSIEKKPYYYVVASTPINLSTLPDPTSRYKYKVPINDTIILFSLRESYWSCYYKNELLYIYEMFLQDQTKVEINNSKSIYIPTEQSIVVQSGLNEFIQDCKKHSKMSVRLTSDCVHSDFEFSLKGSTAALNFVFGNK